MFKFLDQTRQIDRPFILRDFVDAKIKAKEWEASETSELKWTVSFVPLFSDRVLNKEEEAQRLKVSYGNLRKIQHDQKELTEKHLREFADVFCERLRKAIDEKILNQAYPSELSRVPEILMSELEVFYGKKLKEAIKNRLAKMIEIDSKIPSNQQCAGELWQIHNGMLVKMDSRGNKAVYLKHKTAQRQDFLMKLKDKLIDESIKTDDRDSLIAEINFELGQFQEIIEEL